MDPYRERLAGRMLDLIEGAYVAIRSSFVGEWPQIELTMTQLRALVLLSQEPQRMGSLASWMGIGMSSATSLMDRLVDKGLVERTSDPQDRRVVTCSLTPRGRSEMERFWRIGRLSIRELADRLSTEELEVVVKGLETFHEAILRAHRSGEVDRKSVV